MIVSTTPTLEGQRIAQYHGIVTGLHGTMLIVTAAVTAVTSK